MNESGFTKAILNFNGLTLTKRDSQFRQFSGSSRFTFVKNELFEKKDIAQTAPELAFAPLEIKQLTIDFPSDQVPPEKKLFSLNKKIVSRKIMAYFHSKLANSKLNFFTVTFPIETTDEQAFRILNIALTRLRKGFFLSSMVEILYNHYSAFRSEKWKAYINSMRNSTSFEQLKNYLWVSERQTNNTIHFHIITADKINVLVFNHFVAASIFNANSTNQENLPRPGLSQEKYNGVDVSKQIKDIKDVTKLRKYITKYITKNNSKFLRYCWHCSRSISALFTTKQFEIDELYSKNFPIDMHYKSTCYVVDDFFTFIYYPDIAFSKVFSDMIQLNNTIIDIYLSD